MTTPTRLTALAGLMVATLTLPGYAAAAAKPSGKAKSAAAATPKKAVCCVCATKTGKKILEPVKASAKYKGKTYYFCTLEDKAEFISNPTKYINAVK
jgi:YHS domain-containing protein